MSPQPAPTPARLPALPDEVRHDSTGPLTYTLVRCAHQHCDAHSPWALTDPDTGLGAEAGDWHIEHWKTHAHNKFHLYTVSRTNMQVHLA